MAQVVFFQSDKSDTPKPVVTTKTGEIDFSAVGRSLELDPDSILLCEVTFPHKWCDGNLCSDLSWTDIKNLLDVAGTKEDPVMVSGRTISEAPTEGGSSSKKRKILEEALTERSSERKRYMKDLLAPPDELPGEVADLREFLSKISIPLPVSLERYVSVDDDRLVKVSETEAEQSLAHYVNIACNAFTETPNNELDSSHKLRSVTGDFLLELDRLASSEQELLSLRTTMDLSTNPGTVSTAPALVRLKRPNFSLYVRNALILRWENKIDPAHMSSASQENIDKLQVGAIFTTVICLT